MGNSVPYVHSNGAIQVAVKQLAIARLCYSKEGAPVFNASLAKRDEVVKNVYTVALTMEKAINGVQSYYGDVNMIGRHYLVYNKDGSDKKRQYTICNCMEQVVYEEYMNPIRSFNDNLK